jgi:hypothetical protein
MEINWKEVTSNQMVIELLKQREEIESKIRELDDCALINYELVKLEM